MSRFALFCALLMLCCGYAIAQQDARSMVKPEILQSGIVIPDLRCGEQSDQSYALYLPSNYTGEKNWPIVYAFDPDARGIVPVELMKDAAEHYGYILAGSNDARNGPWKPLVEAAQAVFHDTHSRLAIDDHRVYFAGLSGTARFAASLAQQCKCAAGVLLSGAGFAPQSPPTPGGDFSVFATVGIDDFNYGELVALDEKLTNLHYAHALRRFDGPHDWPPANVMDEAFAWFRLIAMRDGRESVDPAFIKEQVDQAEKRAQALDAAGDAYGSWEEYRQMADTFQGLSDVSAKFRQRAAELQTITAVRDGAKREKQAIEEQSWLSEDILSGLAALREDPPDAYNQVQGKIVNLRARADHEKNPQQLTVMRRALGAVYIQALEDAQALYDQKDVSHALAYYELAADAEPDSVPALKGIATTRAVAGDHKGTLEALRKAKIESKDAAAFAAWLKKEPAFAKWRDTPEFRALVAPQ
jgi:tetratricopeptide (TPR) repeat protein